MVRALFDELVDLRDKCHLFHQRPHLEDKLISGQLGLDSDLGSLHTWAVGDLVSVEFLRVFFRLTLFGIDLIGVDPKKLVVVS